MKWPLVFALVLVATGVGAALYMHGLDPRPAGREMQARVQVALTEMQRQVTPNSTATAMVRSYADFARQIALIQIEYGSDPDLIRQAHLILLRPAPVAGKEPDQKILQELHMNLVSSLALSVGHVGTPDDRFAETLLPLETASAELGRLVAPEKPPTALRARDPATLMAASSALAVRGWLKESAHSH